VSNVRPVLVVKVGTSTLLDSTEAPSYTFEYVAASILALRDTYNVVLVTSGAIGFGVRRIGLSERPTRLEQLQALSMIGQVGLLKRWREAFHETTLGQVLVTRRDLERNTTAELFVSSINAVWAYGGVPIVNENDAVSTDEISFGDNDSLAAEVAVVLKADSLVLLTDQDGIQANYGTDSQSRLEVVTVHGAAQHIAPTKSLHGKGGASSKLIAAELALRSGSSVYVSHAGRSGSIEAALSGKLGTKIVQ